MKKHDSEIIMMSLQLLANQYQVTFALFEDTGFPEIDKKLREARVKFADTIILLSQCKAIIDDDRHQKLMNDLAKFNLPLDYKNEEN